MASTVWRGNIAFGLVSIPVRLVRAARRERIRFHQVARVRERAPQPGIEDEPDEPPYTSRPEPDYPEAPVEPVHRMAVGASSIEVPSADILKGYEVAPDRYVALAPREVKALKPETSTTIEIGSFVHVSEIDPLFFDASYYVLPQPAGEKPYALLFRAASETGYAALGGMAMHGREHAVLIRPGATGLILETLFYENEVHSADQYHADPTLAAAAELKLAEQFIDALAAPFEPKLLVDRYEARLRELIDQRSAAPAAVEHAEAKAPVVDIMAALRKSLEAAKKPAKSETAKPKRAAKRKVS